MNKKYQFDKIFNEFTNMSHYYLYNEKEDEFMEELELVFPTKEYKKQIEEYVEEFIRNNENEIVGDANLCKIKDFDKWLKNIECDLSEEKVEEGEVPSTIYLTIRKSDNKIVGNIQINHYLNEELLHYGGHIRNSIRPSERKKGYATEQIRLGLEKCKELGIGRVFLDSYKDNIASMKSIISNGGILENEIKMPNGRINQRYWITLKKRYANRHKLEKTNSNLIYLVKSFEENCFNGDVCYYNFRNANIKISIPNGKIIIDNNYKLLEFYNYSSKVKLSAFYDKNSEIIEWYFDIAKKIGKENGIPYEDDLYLDVVVRPDGKIILLDEKELKEALKRFEITKEEYEMAYEEANKLMMLLKEKKEKLNIFTNKYLNYFEKLDLR